LTRWLVGAGGISVIIAILLIFFYLLYVVVPLAESPGMQREAAYALADADRVVYLSMEEQAEIGAVIDSHGRVRFLSTVDGREISRVQLPVPDRAGIVSFSAARPNSVIVAVGFRTGQAVGLELDTRVSLAGEQRF
jgi:phosphate transport system permease protein